MSHPLLLIVDKDDNPTGEATFEEADKNNLIRRIVRLMLENKIGQVLLQKRRDDDLVYPGRWDNSVAGHVDAGESNIVAIRRETSEEIGIEIPNMKKVGKYYLQLEDRGFVIRKFNHVYKAKYDGPVDNISSREVSRVKWFNVDELKKLLVDKPEQFTDGVREVIARFY